MKTLFKLALLPLLLFACHQPASSELDIIRGRPVPITSPAYYNTVQISSPTSGCTASIIGLRMILTAAHCVADAQASDIKVHFSRGSSAEKLIGVSRVQMFKKEGSAFFPNFDIAWLELNENVPAPFKPMELLRDPSQLTEATPIILAGYGIQKDDCSGIEDCRQVLMEGNTELHAYHDRSHIMSLLVFFGDPRKNLSGACYGDSGGPAYAQVNGVWYLVGVTNGFTSTLAPDSDGSCSSGWDVYTFAGDYVPWLEQSSGRSLSVSDSRKNPDRATRPLVMSGRGMQRPTDWSGWVNYANHEDAAWFVMDAILNSAALNYQAMDLEKNQKTEILYRPELSASWAAAKDYLWLSGPGLSDLTPLALFPALQNLTLSTPTIQDIRSLDGLPHFTSLSMSEVRDVAPDLFEQIPRLKNKLSFVSLNGWSETAVSRLGWQHLGTIASLNLRKSPVDFTQLSGALFTPMSSLSLDTLKVKGTFAPVVMPGTLQLKRVDDSEQRPPLSWLENRRGLRTLNLRWMSADSLDLADFPELIDLEAESMGLTDLDRLTLPANLQTISVSSNRITTLPQSEVWKKLKSIAAYDNPLLDTNCPAAECRFDRHVSPKTLKEYCENTTPWSGYSHGYLDVLWSIMFQGPANSNGRWTLACDTIEDIAPKVKAISVSEAEDIRPLQFLLNLETLFMINPVIRDFSLLPSLENLQGIVFKGVPSFDLSLFRDKVGLQISGLESPDLNRETCPIPVGTCGFVQDGKYLTLHGPILGTWKETVGSGYREMTLPGLKKTFKP